MEQTHFHYLYIFFFFFFFCQKQSLNYVKLSVLCFQSCLALRKWAASWQNQQCGCAPSKDSDQPVHPPSLIRVFAVRMKKACVLSYPLSAQRRLWSDRADAQADLSLRWAHICFVCFVMRRLIMHVYGLPQHLDKQQVHCQRK